MEILHEREREREQRERNKAIFHLQKGLVLFSPGSKVLKGNLLPSDKKLDCKGKQSSSFAKQSAGHLDFRGWLQEFRIPVRSLGVPLLRSFHALLRICRVLL